MSDTIKFIPLLPAFEPWPTRKTPQSRFDTSVKTSMNRMSYIIDNLNNAFIPAVNAIIDDINLILAEQVHIEAIGENIHRIIGLHDNLPMLHVVQDNLPMLQIVYDKLPHIEAAPAYADTAKEYLEQVSLIASPGILSSSAYNIRKPFVVTEDLAAGSSLTLPAHYFPKRDTLFLGFEGTICSPRKAGVEAAGEYQYTEVGEDPNEPSNKVIIHFDAPIGSVFDVWVVASAAGLNIQRTEELVAEAIQYQKGAEAAADKAATSAVEAATAVANATEQANRAEGEANRAVSIVGTGPHPHIHTFMQEEDAEDGATLPTPSYYPFVGGIHVYYEGLLLTSGVHYAEVPAEVGGGTSTSINILFATEAGALWEFHTWDSTQGTTPTQSAISMTQVGVNETEADDVSLLFVPHDGGETIRVESEMTVFPKTTL